MTADGAMAALDRLLAAERAALLAGRLADLPQLAVRKADLVQRICKAGARGPQLDRIGRALRRHEHLLRAARDGARLAARLPREGEPLSVYGPDGASGPIAPQVGRVARRY